MVVIGRVVALREKLNWFERRPLFGRRIVVTRARAQASEFAALLEEQGAEVIELPTFRIEPPPDPGPLREQRRAGGRDVRLDRVHQRQRRGGVLRRVEPRPAWTPARWRAAGSRRSARRRRSGWRNTAFARTCSPARSPRRPSSRRSPRRATSRAGASCVRRSDIAPPELTDALRERGAVVTEVIAYRTVPDDSNAARVKDLLLRGEVHWLTFTSSSTVRYFCAAVEPKALASEQRQDRQHRAGDFRHAARAAAWPPPSRRRSTRFRACSMRSSSRKRLIRKTRS